MASPTMTEPLTPPAAATPGRRRWHAPVFGRLLDALSGLGSLLIAAMMLLVCADVAARNLLSRPITGVTELVALGVVAVVFLQLPAALRHGRLSRAEIFIDGLRRRRPRAAALLQALLHACGFFFCAIVFAATLSPFAKSWTSGDFIGVEGVFTAPTWPVVGIVLVGSACTALQFALLALLEWDGAATTGGDA
ncbi:TRAP transporter small permease subunit [Ramlibacter sp. AW1]|uniref:TRAP transporter small permease protein n=1 Tax=Ramlibacter aurantiacus TaxID=2801330 RepID=A0A937D5S2_9BURK|nr:TRAP transporter small permease subunit [Ramlibacter aurantiacus]MBL0423005.1 TRAP transporter small permease subunit [Ramlibacter aurantiacus]